MPFGYTECPTNECPPLAPAGPAGTPGVNGTPGANGTNGRNCFTVSTASFVVPAVGSTVAVTVADTSWMATGQLVFVEDGGTFEIADVTSATVALLKNRAGYSNVAVGVSVVQGAKVTPTGPKGETGDGVTIPVTIATGGTGQTEKGAAFNALAPTTTKGDLIAFSSVVDGLNTITTNKRLAVGANGLPLVADSATEFGLAYKAIDLAGAGVTGTLPPSKGGMGNVAGIEDNSVLVYHPTGPLTGLKYVLNAVSDPGATDDTNDGFNVGSRWVRQGDPLAVPPVDALEFVCVDATAGAAIWRPTTQVAGGATYTRKIVSGATYNVLRTDSLLAVTSNTCIVTLADGASWPNHFLFIKHEGGGTPNITVQGLTTAQKIEGVNTFTLNVKGGTVVLYWNGAEWKRADKRPTPIDVSEGGTSQSAWTAMTLVRVSADGSKLESIPPNTAILPLAMPIGLEDGSVSGLTISTTYSQSEIQALRTKCEALRDIMDTTVTSVNALLGYLRAAGGTKFING